jgi:hypothetical protein
VALQRWNQRWGAIALGTLVLAACTSPRGGTQRLDREIQARIADSPLPSATRSTLDPVPAGVRMWLHAGTVEVDDVGPWAALSEEQLQRVSAERGGPPWTHVRALALPPREPGGSTSSWLVPELASVLQRAGDGANAALELRGEDPRDRYAVFVDEGASYEDVVRLLYTAIQAKLSHPSLGVRRSDGTLGTLPVGVTKICPVDQRPEHTGSCSEATFTVVETKIFVRGRPSHQRRDECIYVQSAKRMAEMAELVGALETLRKADDGKLPFDSSWFEDGPEHREPPPPRPPPPCRVVELQRVTADATVLHRALEEIANGEPCHQASLAASGSTRWRDVIMVFDAVRSLGHGFVTLEHSDGDAEGCEP